MDHDGYLIGQFGERVNDVAPLIDVGSSTAAAPTQMPSVSEDEVKKQQLQQVMKTTGTDEEMARTYLEINKYNVQHAINEIKAMKILEQRHFNNNQGIHHAEFEVGPCETESQSPSQTKTTQLQKKGQQRPLNLRRGLSMASTELIASARQKIEESEKPANDDNFEFFEDTPNCTFPLPNITREERDFVEFLKADLIDKHTFVSLSDAGHLNWASDNGYCRKIFPMSTVGDGNCLLHAASLGMWGFHDHYLTLRKALYRSLTSGVAGKALKRRWKYQQWKLNMEAGGLSFSKEEWEEEWEGIVRLASDTRRAAQSPKRKISRQYSIATTPSKDMTLRKTDSEGSDSFESLEEFHVFALCHVLRRPIIVVSDKMLRDINGQPMQPIHFGGIYLPLECDPDKCYKFPLVLGYDSGHFASLVIAEGEDVGSKGQKLSSSVPLVEPDLTLLPIHFIVDPGQDWELTEDDEQRKTLEDPSYTDRLGLLSKYLNVIQLVPESKTEQLLKFVSNSNASSFTEVLLKPKDVKNLQLKVKNKDPPGSKSPNISRALESISSIFGELEIGQPNERMMIAAKLDTTNRPKHYDDMIKNFMNDSRERFEEKVKKKRAEEKNTTRCLSPGCSLYGTAATNYLCSRCYQHQRNMSNQIQQRKALPTVNEAPPMYQDAMRQVPAVSPSRPYTAVAPNRVPETVKTDSREIPVQVERPASAPVASASAKTSTPSQASTGKLCRTQGCKFYGNQRFDGYCSSCYGRLQFKSNDYV